jgi:hypothetical protein
MSLRINIDSCIMFATDINWLPCCALPRQHARKCWSRNRVLAKDFVLDMGSDMLRIHSILNWNFLACPAVVFACDVHQVGSLLYDHLTLLQEDHSYYMETASFWMWRHAARYMGTSYNTTWRQTQMIMMLKHATSSTWNFTYESYKRQIEIPDRTEWT